jgi:hypothetical protein
MELSSEQKDLIISGLNMKKNWIETGTPTLSARDAEEIIRSYNLVKSDMFQNKPPKINKLNEDQKKLILEIESLLQKLSR